MKRVLITGATGFIGGRVAEVLVERGMQVVALVRRWAGASRLARLPVAMVGGDVLDGSAVRKAMSGCDTVVHCAVDFRSWGRAHTRSSADGTRTVMTAAGDMGVKRVVHLSSTAVFGLSPERGRVLTEDSALRRVGHDYCDGKIASERVAMEFYQRHGLGVCVLRPTVVYGPFGYYSDAVARAARTRRLALIDGATGTCNCLYVDNLVQAIILAAEREEAVGQIFHVADARPVRWSEYLERHAAALGPEYVPLPVIARGDLTAAHRRQRGRALRKLAAAPAKGLIRELGDPLVKRGLFTVPGVAFGADAAKRFIRNLPPAPRARFKGAVNRAQLAASASSEGSGHAEVATPLTSKEVESFSVFEHVTFSIEKARRILGYDPAVDFAEGMARTAAWIRWANI